MSNASTSRLSESQKEALTSILLKMKSGKKLSQADVGLLGWEVRHCPQVMLIEVFGVTKMTIRDWEKKGMPRHSDGAYDLNLCVNWKLHQDAERYRKDSNDCREPLEIEKLQLQIERQKLEIEKFKENTISLSDAKFKMFSRIQELKEYLLDYGKLSLSQIANSSVENMLPWWDEFVKVGMKHFAAGHE